MVDVRIDTRGVPKGPVYEEAVPILHRDALTAPDAADPTSPSEGVSAAGYRRVRFDVDTTGSTGLTALKVQLLHWNSAAGKYFRGAERELTKLKVLRYLEGHEDEEHQGIVTGVKQYGIFVELSKFIVDGFVHIRQLPDRNRRFAARGRRLVGKKRGSSLRLGDAVVVKVKAIDLAARELDLVLVSRIPGRHRGKSGKK